MLKIYKQFYQKEIVPAYYTRFERGSLIVKHFAALLLVVSLLYFIPNVATAKQDDLTGHGLEHEMRAVIEKGIISGYRPGVFAPNDSVTRAQFATFLARALDLPPGELNFRDVSSSYMLRDGIARAASAQLVSGYPDGSFRPNDFITREQMAAMIDRALAYQKVERVPVFLSFSDTNQIHPDFRTPVSHNTYFGIITGSLNKDGSFRFDPKQRATRAHAAAFINRMLRVIETGGERTVVYRIATIDTNGNVSFTNQAYMNFSDALKNLKDEASQVIYQGQDVVYMKNGLAVTAPSQGLQSTVIIYDSNMSTQLTYLPAGVELRYLDADKDKVRVQIADTVGFIKQGEVKLIPSRQVKGRTYYQNVGGTLTHYVYQPLTNTFVSYGYGPAPSFLQPNERYFSINGRDFFTSSGTKVGEAHQYFNYLPLRSKTNYSAEELNAYIRAVRPESPLKDLGATFKEAEEKYQINALYLFAKAIHESNFGMSEIAREKKNLFGYQAYDRDPLGNAKPFESFEESILFVAEAMNRRYLDPAGENYRGAILGNKSLGMNVRYASDPYWGQKISGHMNRADLHLGRKDYNFYTIGITSGYEDRLNVRPQPNTSQAAQFSFRGPGHYVVLLEETNQADGKWYKIYSDSKDHEFGYIHGNFVKPISIAK